LLHRNHERSNPGVFDDQESSMLLDRDRKAPAQILHALRQRRPDGLPNRMFDNP
jgi:hypothetical protein